MRFTATSNKDGSAWLIRVKTKGAKLSFEVDPDSTIGDIGDLAALVMGGMATMDVPGQMMLEDEVG